MSHKITRRAFLMQSTLAAVGMAALACGQTAKPIPSPLNTVPPPAVPKMLPTGTNSPAPAPAPLAAAASAYKEAPELAALVKAGKLLPAEQRLPKTPKLVNELPERFLKLEIGRYGGQMRTVSTTPTLDTEAFCAQNEPLINSPGVLGEEFYPNVLEAYNISADHKEYTFRLREGLKWSDGQPVTTEDVRFAVDDVLFNTELIVSVPAWLRARNDPRGNPPKCEIVDRFTWKLTFDEPYGGFEHQLAVSAWRSYVDLLKPAHYLKQYHRKYADHATLKAEIEKAKLETWVQLFNRKDITNWEFQQPGAVGFPRLYPWLLTAVEGTTFTCERNPYYFKVDAAGQQLPYLDRLVGQVVADAETQALKIMAGEVDFTARYATLMKMPLYREHERNGYRVQVATDNGTHGDAFLNQTHKDEIWREVVRNKRFRQALNMAIDRREVLDTVYFGHADLPTWVPAEHDPKKAMQILDEIGLDRRDAEGFRLGPDRKTFVIPIEYSMSDPTFQPCAQIIAENWRSVGVKTTLHVIDPGLWTQRNNANELRASVLWGEPLFFKADLGQSRWGPLWWRWVGSRGAEGEAPPAEIKTLLDLILSVQALPPPQARQRLAEARQHHYDLVCWMPPVENIRQPLIVNARYGNVPQTDKVMGIAVNFAAEQFYMKP